MKTLSVAKEYSLRTGLRYSVNSEYSGEDFYHDCLNARFYEAYLNDEELELSFDGTEDGCGPSFIDESIGNLVYDFTLEVVKSHLSIISNDIPMWLDMINDETYPDWEQRRQAGDEPKITKEHQHPWVRLVEGQPQSKVWITKITSPKEI